MPRTHEYLYTVTGRGLFPFDMLRYDQCWPASEGDSATIEATTRRNESGVQHEIRLRSHSPNRGTGRWASFRWTVSEQEKRQV